MNTDQKIAFRRLLSDILQYMAAPGRDKNEVLTAMDKLEKQTSQLMFDCVAAFFPEPPKVIIGLSDAERAIYRKDIALFLETIALPHCKPETVIEMIHVMESWLEERISNRISMEVGRPRLQIKRLPNNQTLN